MTKKIKRNGYYPGVYTASSVYENYLETISLGSTWDFWIASYEDHTYESDEYHDDFSMWQYSNAGEVNGISSDVDLDVTYVDYPEIIKEFKEKEEESINRCMDTVIGGWVGAWMDELFLWAHNYYLSS